MGGNSGWSRGRRNLGILSPKWRVRGIKSGIAGEGETKSHHLSLISTSRSILRFRKGEMILSR